MNENNVKNIVDNLMEIGHNVAQKEKIVKKRPRLPLTQKIKIVEAVAQKHEEGLSIPEACLAAGVQMYTYYNYKKRLEQLATRRPKSLGSIRKLPVIQTVQEPKVQNDPLQQFLREEIKTLLKDEMKLQVRDTLKELFQ